MISGFAWYGKYLEALEDFVLSIVPKLEVKKKSFIFLCPPHYLRIMTKEIRRKKLNKTNN